MTTLLEPILDSPKLPELVDCHLGKHHLHQGLSPGALLVVWLAYILAYGDHRKAALQEWAARYPLLLNGLLGTAPRPTEFTDDRLTLLLRRLSHEPIWHALEADLWHNTSYRAVFG